MDNLEKNELGFITSDVQITSLGKGLIESSLGKLKSLTNGSNCKNLQLVATDMVQVRDKNPRKHAKKQLQKLKNAIQKLRFINPIIIDEKGILIAGELRLQAAKDFKMSQVPALILEDITEEEARAIRIADNRIAEDAIWDFSLLQEELNNLVKFDIKFDDVGFEPIDYEKIFLSKDSPDNKVHNEETEDSSWLDENIPILVKKGDLIRLGDHFLVCGDSLNPATFAFLMQGELAQIVIADSPYNCTINKHVCGLGKVKHEEFEMASGEMTDAEFSDFIFKFMQNLVKFSADGSLHYLFIDWVGLNKILTQGSKLYTELKNIAVWDKGVGGMGAFYRSQHEMVPIFKNGKAKHQNHIQLGKYGRYRTNVWEYPGIRATNPGSLELLKLHPTVKPVAMLHDILLDASSKNDIVLDCFGGSGSTLLAAERSGRRARIIEISPRYCDVIIWRWEKETGKKAKIIKNIGDINDEQ